MRKETNKKKRNSKIYIMGLISIAIILSIIVLYYNLNKVSTSKTDTTQVSQIDNNVVINDVVEQASLQIGKSIEEVQEETNTIEIKEKVAINTSMIDNITKKENITVENKAISEEIIVEKEELAFCMPVDGEIVKEFAKDTLLYSTTLDEWTTHTGIDIKAEKTTIVKAAEKGTVKYIKNDPRYGLTIVIEHSDGYTTVYSNLLTSEFVVEGEKIEKGQTIGTVGNTAAFEIADESHLHFEILKDNVQVDPKSYLK